MRAALVVVLIGCGSSTATPPLSQSKPRDQPRVEDNVWIDRHLTLESTRASRSEWVLTIAGGHATLVASFSAVDGPLAIENAETAAWRVTETRTEKGPAHVVGDHLALDLESPSDSLYLRCWKRTIVAATAGAKRIVRPGHFGDCDDNGTWSPPKMVHVEALICGQGEALDDGQELGIDGQKGSLDETLFRFMLSPGIEFVQVVDGCFSSSGLRLATAR